MCRRRLFERVSAGWKPRSGLHLLHHLARAEVAGQEDQAFSKLTVRVVAEAQRGVVEHAEQQRRQRRRRLFDLVEEHEARSESGADHVEEPLLGQHRLRFAVAEVAGRRADQLGDLVIRLVLAAVDLQDVLLLPWSISASASTVRVLPVPVGPSRRKMPAGRSAALSPA